MATQELWVSCYNKLYERDPELVAGWVNNSKGETCCEANCPHAEKDIRCRTSESATSSSSKKKHAGTSSGGDSGSIVISPHGCGPLLKCREAGCTQKVHLHCGLRFSADSLRVRVSGEAEIYCPMHIKPILYCTCRKPFNEIASAEEAMIQCEQCQEWYHFQCVKVNPKSKKAMESFICMGCKSHNTQMTQLLEAQGQDAHDVAVKAHMHDKLKLANKKEMQDMRNQHMLFALGELLQRAQQISECVDELGLSLTLDTTSAKTCEPTQICIQQCLECCALLESEPQFRTDGSASAAAGSDPTGTVANATGTDSALKKWQIALNIVQECSTMQGNDVIFKSYAALQAHSGRLIQWAKEGEQIVHKLCHVLLSAGIAGSINSTSSAIVAHAVAAVADSDAISSDPRSTPLVELTKQIILASYSNWQATFQELQEWMDQRDGLPSGSLDVACASVLMECSTWANSVICLLYGSCSEDNSSSSSSGSSAADAVSSRSSMQTLGQLKHLSQHGIPLLAKLTQVYKDVKSEYILPPAGDATTVGGNEMDVVVANAVEDTASTSLLPNTITMCCELHDTQGFIRWLDAFRSSVTSISEEMQTWRKRVEALLSVRPSVKLVPLTFANVRELMQHAEENFPLVLDSLPRLKTLMQTAIELENDIYGHVYSFNGPDTEKSASLVESGLSVYDIFNGASFEALLEQTQQPGLAGISLPSSSVLHAIVKCITFCDDYKVLIRGSGGASASALRSKKNQAKCSAADADADAEDSSDMNVEAPDPDNTDFAEEDQLDLTEITDGIVEYNNIKTEIQVFTSDHGGDSEISPYFQALLPHLDTVYTRCQAVVSESNRLGESTSSKIDYFLTNMEKILAVPSPMWRDETPNEADLSALIRSNEIVEEAVARNAREKAKLLPLMQALSRLFHGLATLVLTKQQEEAVNALLCSLAELGIDSAQKKVLSMVILMHEIVLRVSKLVPSPYQQITSIIAAAGAGDEDDKGDYTAISAEPIPQISTSEELVQLLATLRATAENKESLPADAPANYHSIYKKMKACLSEISLSAHEYFTGALSAWDVFDEARNACTACKWDAWAERNAALVNESNAEHLQPSTTSFVIYSSNKRGVLEYLLNKAHKGDFYESYERDKETTKLAKAQYFIGDCQYGQIGELSGSTQPYETSVKCLKQDSLDSWEELIDESNELRNEITQLVTPMTADMYKRYSPELFEKLQGLYRRANVVPVVEGVYIALTLRLYVVIMLLICDQLEKVGATIHECEHLLVDVMSVDAGCGPVGVKFEDGDSVSNNSVASDPRSKTKKNKVVQGSSSTILFNAAELVASKLLYISKHGGHSKSDKINTLPVSVGAAAVARFKSIGWYAEVRLLLDRHGEVDEAQRLYDQCSTTALTTLNNTDSLDGIPVDYSAARASPEYENLTSHLNEHKKFTERCTAMLTSIHELVLQANTAYHTSLAAHTEGGGEVSKQIEVSFGGSQAAPATPMKDSVSPSKAAIKAALDVDITSLYLACTKLRSSEVWPLKDVRLKAALDHAMTILNVFREAPLILLRIWDQVDSPVPSLRASPTAAITAAASANDSDKPARSPVKLKDLQAFANLLLHLSVDDNNGTARGVVDGRISSEWVILPMLLKQTSNFESRHAEWRERAKKVLPQKSTRKMAAQLSTRNVMMNVLNDPISLAIESSERAYLIKTVEKCEKFQNSVQVMLAPNSQRAIDLIQEAQLYSYETVLLLSEEQIRLMSGVSSSEEESEDSDSGGEEGGGGPQYPDQVRAEKYIDIYKRSAAELTKYGHLLDVNVNGELAVLGWIEKCMAWSFEAPKQIGSRRDIDRGGLSYDHVEAILSGAKNLLESLHMYAGGDVLPVLFQYGVVLDPDAASLLELSNAGDSSSVASTGGDSSQSTCVYSTTLARNIQAPAYHPDAHWLLSSTVSQLHYCIAELKASKAHGDDMIKQYEDLRRREKDECPKGEKDINSIKLKNELNALKNSIVPYNKAHVINLPKNVGTTLSKGLFSKTSHSSSSSSSSSTSGKSVGKGDGKSSKSYKIDIGDDGPPPGDDDSSSSDSSSSSSGSDNEESGDDDNASVGSKSSEVGTAAGSGKIGIGADKKQKTFGSKLSKSNSNSANRTSSNVSASSGSTKRKREEEKRVITSKDSVKEHKEKRKNTKSEPAEDIEPVEHITRVTGPECANEDCPGGPGLGFVPMLLTTVTTPGVGGASATTKSSRGAAEYARYCSFTCAQTCAEKLFENMLAYRSRLVLATAAGLNSGSDKILADDVDRRKMQAGEALHASLIAPTRTPTPAAPDMATSTGADAVATKQSNIIARKAPMPSQQEPSEVAGADAHAAATAADFLLPENLVIGRTTVGDREAFAVPQISLTKISSYAAQTVEIHDKSAYPAKLVPPTMLSNSTSVDSSTTRVLGDTNDNMNTFLGEDTFRAGCAAHWTSHSAIEQVRMNIIAALGPDIAKKEPKGSTFAMISASSLLSSIEHKHREKWSLGSQERQLEERGDALLSSTISTLLLPTKRPVTGTSATEKAAAATTAAAGAGKEKATDVKPSEEIAYRSMTTAAGKVLTVPATPAPLLSSVTSGSGARSVSTSNSAREQNLRKNRLQVERSLRKTLFLALLSLTQNPASALFHASAIANMLEEELFNIAHDATNNKDAEQKRIDFGNRFRLLNSTLNTPHVRNTIVRRLLKDYRKKEPKNAAKDGDSAVLALMTISSLARLTSEDFRSDESRQKLRDAERALQKEHESARMAEFHQSQLEKSLAGELLNGTSPKGVKIELEHPELFDPEHTNDGYGTGTGSGSATGSPNGVMFGKRGRDQQGGMGLDSPNSKITGHGTSNGTSIYSDDVYLEANDRSGRIGGSGATDEAAFKRSREAFQSIGTAGMTTVTDVDVMDRSHLTKKVRHDKNQTVTYIPGVAAIVSATGTSGSSSSTAISIDSPGGSRSGTPVLFSQPNVLVQKTKILTMAEKMKARGVSFEDEASDTESGGGEEKEGGVAKATVGFAGRRATAAIVAKPLSSELEEGEEDEKKAEEWNDRDTYAMSAAAPAEADIVIRNSTLHPTSPQVVQARVERSHHVTLTNQMLAQHNSAHQYHHHQGDREVWNNEPDLDHPTYLLNEGGAGTFTFQFTQQKIKHVLTCFGVIRYRFLQGLLPKLLALNNRMDLAKLIKHEVDLSHKSRKVLLPLVFRFHLQDSSVDGALYRRFWTEYTPIEGGEHAGKVGVVTSDEKNNSGSPTWTLYIIPPKHREKLATFKNDPVFGNKHLRDGMHKKAEIIDQHKRSCLYAILEYDQTKPPRNDLIANLRGGYEGLIAKAGMQIDGFLTQDANWAAQRKQGGHGGSGGGGVKGRANSLGGSSSDGETFNPAPAGFSTSSAAGQKAAAAPAPEPEPKPEPEPEPESESNAAILRLRQLTYHDVAGILGEKGYQAQRRKKMKVKKTYQTLAQHLQLCQEDRRSIEARWEFLYPNHKDHQAFLMELQQYDQDNLTLPGL